jgi:hypothetical protein
MSYKNQNSSAMLVVISIIALTLVTATSFNHSYSALAVLKIKTGDKSASSAAPDSVITSIPIIDKDSAQQHETIITTPGQGQQQFYDTNN